MSGCVHNAVKSLWRIVTDQQNVVPVSVVTESVPPTLVYNLTLEKHNAYYANGVLVYNCLTFAYPISQSDHTHIFENRLSQHQIQYDPLSREHIAADLGVGYNPFKR